MIKFKNQPVVIYPKDVQIITNRCYRTACRNYALMLQHFGKSKTQVLTTREFCAYTGIPFEDVLVALNPNQATFKPY